MKCIIRVDFVGRWLGWWCVHCTSRWAVPLRRVVYGAHLVDMEWRECVLGALIAARAVHQWPWAGMGCRRWWCKRGVRRSRPANPPAKRSLRSVPATYRCIAGGHDCHHPQPRSGRPPWTACDGSCVRVPLVCVRSKLKRQQSASNDPLCSLTRTLPRSPVHLRRLSAHRVSAAAPRRPS